MNRIWSRFKRLAWIMPLAVLPMLVAPVAVRADPLPLAVSTTTLSDATVGVAYSQTLAATGGTAPYQWAITSGALPPALALNAATGAISGTPTTAGDYAFTAQATDADAHTATGTLTIHVRAATDQTLDARVLALCGGDTSAHPALGVLCGLYTGGQLPAWAQPVIARLIVKIAQPVERELSGKVAAIAGATLTVDTEGGQRTVITDADTVFTLDGQAATLADVAVGMRIKARGTVNAAGALLATRVALKTVNENEHVSGTVAAIAGATITVDTEDGQRTVITNADTTFTLDGQPATLADVAVGMHIKARGTVNADDALLATRVALKTKEHVSGKVTAIDGANIIVGKDGKDDEDNETRTIVTTDATVFTLDGQPATLSDVKVGMKVRATGTLDADGNLLARSVLIAAPERHHPGKSCDEHGRRGEHGNAFGIAKRCDDGASRNDQRGRAQDREHREHHEDHDDHEDD